MIPDATIDEIRSKADIVAVIGEHVQLRKAGRSFKGLCPFHGEKTPSFNVVPDKGIFHCFGCKKTGDVFTFVMELQGRSFVEAAEALAERCGIRIEQKEESPELRRMRSERTSMLELNKVATALFREVLADPKRGAVGRAYLDKRGIDQATRDRFQLGYAPNDWSTLVDYLKAKRCDLDLALRLELIGSRPRSNGYYDKYRERLVCPVVVPGGEIVGFSARVVDGVPGVAPAEPDRDPPPKYVNSRESTVYKKGKVLYGLAQAREAMGSKKRAVIVEGNFDVISMHQAGFTEVVAPLGTALTADQLELLRRMTERVILLYDGDSAGYRATLHSLQLCAAAGIDVAVVPLERGVDPDSWVRTTSAEVVKTTLDRARDGVEFFATEVWARARGNQAAIARALDDAMLVVSKVGNPTHRELVLGKLSAALDVDRRVVDAAFHRANRPGRTDPGGSRHPNDARSGQNAPAAHSSNPGAPAATRPGPPPPTDEVEVIAVLADHPSLLLTVEADKAFSLLTDAVLRDICSAARAGKSLIDLVTSPDAGLHASSATLVLSGKYAAETDPRARLAAMAANLDHRHARAQLADMESLLAEAYRKGDRERARELASEIVSKRKKDD